MRTAWWSATYTPFRVDEVVAILNLDAAGHERAVATRELGQSLTSGEGWARERRFTDFWDLIEFDLARMLTARLDIEPDWARTLAAEICDVIAEDSDGAIWLDTGLRSGLTASDLEGIGLPGHLLRDIDHRYRKLVGRSFTVLRTRSKPADALPRALDVLTSRRNHETPINLIGTWEPRAALVASHESRAA